MKKLKVVLSSLLLLVIAFSLSGCFLTRNTRYYSNDYEYPYSRQGYRPHTTYPSTRTNHIRSRPTIVIEPKKRSGHITVLPRNKTGRSNNSGNKRKNTSYPRSINKR